MKSDVSKPLHLGVIMDGNGRWAKKRSLSRGDGHREGAKVTKDIIPKIQELGVQHLSLFGFSTENWRRPQEEVAALMSLFEEAFTTIEEELSSHQIRFDFIGSKAGLPQSLIDKMEKTTAQTRNMKGMRLYLALNYGGRADILCAVKRMLQSHSTENIPMEKIDEELFSWHMNPQGKPDPDIILRTGGEMRISNFYLWQAAYSELFFTPTLWPDITIEEIARILDEFRKRERRYGDTL